MDIRIIEQAVKDTQCDALAVGATYKKVGNQAKELMLSATAREVDSLLGGLIQSIYAEGEFKGDLGELLTLHPMGKLAAKRIVVVGMGPEEKIHTQVIRRASATATRHLQQTGAHQVALALQSEEFNLDLDESVRAAVEGVLLGTYTFTKYKQSNGNGRGITKINLLVNGASNTMLDQAMRHAIALAEATNFARDLVNEPPDVLTPSELANRAGTMAKQFGLECEILDRPEMQELGMGGLLAVARGSSEPPKFIILRYRGAPQSPGKGMALVGKGITFDSGGLSLKSAEQMQDIEMLLALRHHTVVGRDREEHEIDPVRAGQHVADKALMSGHIDHAGAAAVGQVEVGEAQIDRDAALFLFLQAIGVVPGERLDQRGLAVIDMTRGADDRVGN